MSAHLRDKVEQQIKEEISKGHYKVTSCRPTVISALGAIPKDTGDIRLIHDCSRPAGLGLNSYATVDKLSFTALDDATKHITRHTWLAKVDIKAAYRHVGIHPSMFTLTGLKYKFAGDQDFTIFYDSRLPFGASQSVGCFHRITQSVVRMIKRRCKCRIVCYLDDFLIISDSRDRCQASMDSLINLLQQLGFTINRKKVVPPSQSLTFLGININCPEGTLSIPGDKLAELKTFACNYISKSKVTKRELQRLIGKISWTSKCIKSLRPVLRSLIDLQAKLRKPSHRVRLPAASKNDIALFCDWCTSFNGVVFLPDTKTPLPATTLYTDASLTAGAAFCNNDFLYCAWEFDFPELANEHIYVKEIWSALLAFRRWRKQWQNSAVHLFTDNKGTEWAIRKGTTRNKIANRALKELLWIAAYNNIDVISHYINTKDNYVADALSRMHEPHYFNVSMTMLYRLGVDVSHPCFNWLHHMSYYTLAFLVLNRDSARRTGVG